MYFVGIGEDVNKKLFSFHKKPLVWIRIGSSWIQQQSRTGFSKMPGSGFDESGSETLIPGMKRYRYAVILGSRH